MRETVKAVLFVIVCTLLTSVAQVFYKLASSTLELNFVALITNYNLIIGLACYAIAVVFLLLAFKLGELSLLFPIVSTSYIWVAILSFILFNESMTAFKIIGILTISIGVVLIGSGDGSGSAENRGVRSGN